MFLRTTTSRTKAGPVRYLQLAHSVRNRETGSVIAQILYNFGRADRVDHAALQRLVQSVQRFLGPEGPSDAAQAATAGEFLSARAMGGCWVLDWLWRRLGIAAAVQRVLPTDQERELFALVANRALAPSSKLSVTDWLAESVYVPGLSPLALPEDEQERDAERKRRVNRLYAAMDTLAEVEQQIQREVFWSVSQGDLLRVEVDLLYFDTTTTYWEAEALAGEDESGSAEQAGTEPEAAPSPPQPQALRRWSRHGKDHRPDLPQIVIGLAVTREGIPIRCWSWPGNTTDASVIKQVKADLMGWKLGRVISVVDRGFTSEDNLRELQLGGGHYIAGERMRSGKAAVEAALARAGRYKSVRDNIQLKEIVVGEGEARQRFVLVRNPFEAERNRKERERIVSELQEALAQLAQSPGEPHSKKACELRAHPSYGPYLTTDAQGRLRINRDKVRAEARLDGKYLIRTSDDTLSAEDVALGYRQLERVEAAFRNLKTTLDLRPVYHRLEERIRAHVVLCWLALLLVRVAEVKTGESWPRLRRQLETMHLVHYRTGAGTLARRTVTTPGQRKVLGALGAPEPLMIFDLTPTTDPVS